MKKGKVVNMTSDLNFENITQDEMEFVMTAYKLILICKEKKIGSGVKEFVMKQINEFKQGE